jgi:hypothetical protein
VSTSVRLAADGIWALLTPLQTMAPESVTAAVPAAGVFVYRGEVKDSSGNPSTPPVDPDALVHPHLIFYPSSGRVPFERLGGGLLNVNWGFQVTCVGGDENRCMWAVDKVRAALLCKRITLDGAQSGQVYEDADAGPVRRDDAEQPPRYFVPLLFGLRI